eukprot:SAG22_NODE_843_length_6889_cov_61.521649_9_plen_64_part_00
MLCCAVLCCDGTGSGGGGGARMSARLDGRVPTPPPQLSSCWQCPIKTYALPMTKGSISNYMHL